MSPLKMDMFSEGQDSQEQPADLYNSVELLNQSLLREKVLRFLQESIWTQLSVIRGRSSPFPIRFDSAAHTGRVGVGGVWNYIHFFFF